ncbi:DNA cytosine methyltransferase [Rahnella aceris]|jgi:DNA (cytosine-5)-methyltransferase 1|uniref:DNA cytosine methyltransferase n=1 Tax=Rahnella sp. (strain Y9602) TaxID=2703885 RepID=UPI000EAC394E|nr:DNA (cytosine-5-)-methyltransferase [Rahnella aceris]MBU9863863.1 DNA cytosine methyltransferase [Rahnella aceris]RKT75897.1 DNA (cytosine-5)-methyltransferase 1 [Rahnella aquatilis]
MSKSIGVVDLFAGPGGLAEGFASFKDESGNHPFKICISIEKESSAHSTLLLRSFLRKFEGEYPAEYYAFLNREIIDEPAWNQIYPKQWQEACEEAKCMELGKKETTEFITNKINSIKQDFGTNTIVIGGPPCQAYSLVGRARNAGNVDYVPQEDHRHFLYKEYVAVLNKLEPAAFIMENVKGMLSSAIKGDRVFLQVMTDLRSAAGEGSYKLFALSPKGVSQIADNNPEPSDFIVRTEDHGVPQARHRVIIVGVRKDVAEGLSNDFRLVMPESEKLVSVHDVIGNMPKLRSGLSKRDDTPEAWFEVVGQSVQAILPTLSNYSENEKAEFKLILGSCVTKLALDELPSRSSSRFKRPMSKSCPEKLRNWLSDSKLHYLPNNETRGHMESDLARYIFAAAFGKIFKRSPKASEYPPQLAPNHKNWESGKFADRFRVQIAEKPSSTITSHISKDGHYFIHHDPQQCRSLTVREAARLQTFPDNYYFKGNRTQQYVQVGNAVPPFFAYQIALALWPILK